MTTPKLRRTPKVFGTSYQPPSRTKANSTFRPTAVSLQPVFRVVLLVLLLFGLSRLPVFRIKHVAIEGADNAQLQTDLQALVGQSIFSRKIGQVTEHWLHTEGSLAILSCHKGLPSSLSCRAALRQPSLIWQQSGKEFLVDKDGVLYAEKGPGPLTVPVVQDQIGSTNQLGTNVASTEVIEQITRLKKTLEEQGIVISRFFITDSLYQVGVIIGGYKNTDNQPVTKELTALFASTQPIDAQAKVLRILLRERGGQITTRIDLRIPGYVYYK